MSASDFVESVASERSGPYEDASTSSLFSLREVQELVALTNGGDWQIIGDAIPQEVWDDLHERGLVTTNQDITGDYETGSTALGIDYVVAKIRPNEADHDNA